MSRRSWASNFPYCAKRHFGGVLIVRVEMPVTGLAASDRSLAPKKAARINAAGSTR
jgi:hypothetical protein